MDHAVPDDATQDVQRMHVIQSAPHVQQASHSVAHGMAVVMQLSKHGKPYHCPVSSLWIDNWQRCSPQGPHIPHSLSTMPLGVPQSWLSSS